MASPTNELRQEFGDIDIYLFDQLLRGRITADMVILDAGCGHGRNLVYFMRHGFSVAGIDERESAIAAVRALGAAYPADRFRVERVDAMSFSDSSFDVVISSAVMHFARDESHWWSMLREMWRVLKPGGLFFARLATSIGHESRVQPVGNGRYVMPDGSTRFLVDEVMVMNATATLGGSLIDPLKTSVVQDLRSMMTWVVRK